MSSPGCGAHCCSSAVIVDQPHACAAALAHPAMSSESGLYSVSLRTELHSDFLCLLGCVSFRAFARLLLAFFTKSAFHIGWRRRVCRIDLVETHFLVYCTCTGASQRLCTGPFPYCERRMAPPAPRHALTTRLHRQESTSDNFLRSLRSITSNLSARTGALGAYPDSDIKLKP